MSRRIEDDVNLNELSKEQLVALVKSERSSSKRRIKLLKRDLNDTRIAHLVAIDQRECAIANLELADHAIMTIVEHVAAQKESKGTLPSSS